MTNQLKARREELVRQHIYAECHQDVDGAVATFIQASYDVVPLAAGPDTPMTHPTEADVRAHLAGLMAAFPDLELKIVELHHAETAVIVEGRMSGTHLNNFGNLPAAGKRMDVRAAVFYRFDEDEMINETVYFDMATMLRQLGAMPEAIL